MRYNTGFRFTGALLAALLVSQGAMAQEERQYDASISLGFVNTTGNTDTTTFNGEGLLTWRTERWTHSLKLQGLAAQEDSVTKAERYYFEDKSDFNLDERQYFYGKASYTDDRFSGFDYQAVTSFGYGRYLVRSDNLDLEAYGGLGYRMNDIEDEGTEDEVITTLGEKLSWQISDSAVLTQSFLAEVGEERTVTRFEVGLESNIIDRISTKIAFQARNTSEVPVGRKKTDTLTSVSLVYTF